ncbi:MAG: imidazoleglycerol-phosphate dehydratase, partial [Faecalimonas sp.]|nr:imidazoleglycerol-phosphate dehydratase [Faecalimonas sp.]
VHHCVEDTGIVLGQAIKEALGDKKGIRRFGDCIIPMDDALALCAIDLSGRPYLNFHADFTEEKVGDFNSEMFREFFYALSYSAAMNLHLKIMDGGNNHHMAEALFKAFGKALDMATSEEPRMKEVWSTKGSLA